MEKHLEFHKDTCDYWKNKIYYWVRLGTDCVCFISIKNPEETDNHWMVWMADMGEEWLGENLVDEEVRIIGWKHVDHCGHCGSCNGGRKVWIG